MSGNAAIDVARVLTSGYIGQGPVVEEFEKRLAETIGNPNVVTVNSCTSGLSLALYMPRFPLNTKMLTTALTCVATNMAGRANSTARSSAMVRHKSAAVGQPLFTSPSRKRGSHLSASR